MRIVVADDEEVIRELIRVTLSADPSFEVHLASDGPSAIETVRTVLPRLLLLDVRMPGMGGVEVCRTIRESSIEPQPSIVMLSAMSQKSDVTAGLEAGADDYFTKPFGPSALLQKVYEVGGSAAA